MNISKYLEKIQNDESIFPMDSPSKKKKTRKYYSEATPKSKASNRMMIDFDLTIYKYSKGFEDGILEDDAFDGAKETTLLSF